MVFGVVKFQFAKVINNNQRISYSEKINLIIEILNGKIEKLNATQRRSAYEESFQNSALKSLQKSYYTSSDHKIYPFILDHGGKIIMHPPISKDDDFFEIESHLLNIVSLEANDFDFVDSKGKKKWLIFKHFPEWNWYIGFVVPWDNKYNEARVLRNHMLLTMTIVLVIAATILFIIIFKITEPIIALTSASKAMANGDLDHPVDVHRNDELGSLALNFTLMRDAIREKIQALTQSEARIKEVIDKSPIAMAVSTPDNRIVIFNQKFIELFKYTLDDIKTVTDWFPKAYPDKKIRDLVEKRWNNEIAHYFKTGKFNTMVESIVCKDGAIRDIVFDFESVGEQYITSFIDITEQNAGQKELIKEKEFSEYIINSMPGIFFLYEYENDKFLLKRWNKNHETILGYNAEELKECQPEVFFQKKDFGFVQAAITDLIERGRTNIEIELLKKNGFLIPFYLQAFSFKEKDQLYFLGTGIDISERKLAEQETLGLQKRLAQAQKMEAIGTIAGGIAHDFNNILSGIFGYSQLAETNIHNPVKAKNHIQQVIKGAQRAAELVHQILTFSRQKETAKHPFKAYLQVNEALKLLRSSIPSTIEIKETIGTRSMILGDPTKIHQIVMNLCTNAYHAMMDKGGILKVSLKDW